jgi:hypothetical protein
MALTFGGPSHSEGLVIRFPTAAGQAWIGNFHGGYGRACGILEHPNKCHVVILWRGQGYIVDPDAPQDVCMFGGAIQDFFSLPEFDAILFADDLGFETINRQGPWWRSPRISWDEIRGIRIDGATLHGEAITPIGQLWVPFTVDLRTGECRDGIYDADMRRATPIRRP